MTVRIAPAIPVAFVLVVASTNTWAQPPLDDLDVTLTKAVGEYCHVIRFPQPWAIQPLNAHGDRLFFGSNESDYEFRVEGILGTQFLVAAYTEEIDRRYYTTNSFWVDFSNPAIPIRPVSAGAWRAAAVVSFTKKSPFPSSYPLDEKPIEYHGFQFSRKGEFWQPYYLARMSPDQTWLILQSEDRHDVDDRTKVFFEAFNTNTGSKLLTIEGVFTSVIGDGPETILGQTGRVTERYFVIPLGKRKERFMVCEFERSGRPKGAQE